MELVEVKGNIEDINNYANLYQKFSSVGSTSVDILRKHFMDSELERYNLSVKDVVRTPVVETKEDSGYEGEESRSGIEKEAVPLEYVEHGVILEDAVTQRKEPDTEVPEEPAPEKEYVEHGVILEDRIEKQEKVEESALAKEYVEHGVILDDGVEEQESLVDKPIEVEKKDEVVGESWYDDEDLWGNPEEEQDLEDEDEAVGWGKDEEDEYVNEEPPEVVTQPEPPKSIEVPENVEVRKTPSFERQKVLTKPAPVHTKEEVRPPTVDSSVKVVNSYPTVRAFVKGNPGCTSSDVVKYFSSSELKKALMSSKIVERKGKLYAV